MLHLSQRYKHVRMNMRVGGGCVLYSRPVVFLIVILFAKVENSVTCIPCGMTNENESKINLPKLLHEEINVK